MKPSEVIRIKELLPTMLGSEEIREKIAADILRRSVFSARMASASYLAKIREVCEKISAGLINQADARAKLLSVLEQMGHSPLDEGGLKNPASIRRLNLIIDTQRQMAASVAQISEETEATLQTYPAWRLTRQGSAADPRNNRQDWDKRWAAAYAEVGGEGALEDDFVALKSSPIWEALGNGAGGFNDALGNPYPPFAYSSRMAWSSVSREEAVSLGLMDEDDEVNGTTASLSPAERDIADAAKRLGFTAEDFRV